MSTTLQRLKLFIDSNDLNISSFEKSMGFSNGSLSNQIKNNKTIGVDKLERILRTFSNLSATWLLTGVGEMLIVNDPSGKELHKHARHNNMIKALKDAPRDKGKFTSRQLHIANNNFEKLADYLRNEQGKYKGLLDGLEKFEDFRDRAEELSTKYLNKVIDSLISTDQYLDGNRFNYDLYKETVLKEMDALTPIVEALKDFNNASQLFESRIDTVLKRQKSTTNKEE